MALAFSVYPVIRFFGNLQLSPDDYKLSELLKSKFGLKQKYFAEISFGK